MRQLLRIIIFAILIVGVITKTESSESTNKTNNKTNNEHNTNSLNETSTVAEFDEELVGAITQVKISVATNETNDEHNISFNINPKINKIDFPTDRKIEKHFLILCSILGFNVAIFTLVCYSFCCHPYCGDCEDWILRFFRPAEMPIREREVELVHMPQRQEEVHNLPPNVIESHL